MAKYPAHGCPLSADLTFYRKKGPRRTDICLPGTLLYSFSVIPPLPVFPYFFTRTASARTLRVWRISSQRVVPFTALTTVIGSQLRRNNQ